MISVYYYLQKTSMSIEMTEENQFDLTEENQVSKAPDSSLIQLKKYTHLKCSPQIDLFG